jgi:hypothetical protein
MDDLLAIAYLWLAHVLITSPVVAPLVWFTRRRVQWHVWESAVFVAPFGVWLALIYFGSQPKSLANLAECYIISCAIAVAALVQALFGKLPGNRLLPVALMTTVIAAGVAAYFLTPVLPE